MKEYNKVQLKVYITPETRKRLKELVDYWALSNSALIESLIIKEYRQDMQGAYHRRDA